MKFQNRAFTGKVKLNTDCYRQLNAEIRGTSLEDYRLGGGVGQDTGSRKRNGGREEKEKSMPWAWMLPVSLSCILEEREVLSLYKHLFIVLLEENSELDMVIISTFQKLKRTQSAVKFRSLSPKGKKCTCNREGK